MAYDPRVLPSLAVARTLDFLTLAQQHELLAIADGIEGVNAETADALADAQLETWVAETRAELTRGLNPNGRSKSLRHARTLARVGEAVHMVAGLRRAWPQIQAHLSKNQPTMKLDHQNSERVRALYDALEALPNETLADLLALGTEDTLDDDDAFRRLVHVLDFAKQIVDKDHRVVLDALIEDVAYADALRDAVEANRVYVSKQRPVYVSKKRRVSGKGGR